MKNSGQHRDWISRARSRSVTIAFAFVVVFAGSVVGTPSAQAQTFTLLHSFQGPTQDGVYPAGELTFDKSGNLYGTTLSGGSSAAGVGTVFKLDTSGKETVLYNFTGTAGDGSQPAGTIVRYGGNIYGTTYYGGAGDCPALSGGCGTVFELSRGTETVLHSFAGDGGYLPIGGLTRDESGNLYGTTAVGSKGALPPACGNQGCGIVFEVSKGQETVLYSFIGRPDGTNPQVSLILDGLGNLFGTTRFGGKWGQGTVFELSPNLDGTWTEHLLYSFTGGRDGAQPAAIVMDVKGNLYGTGRLGGHITQAGNCKQIGCGVVFKMVQNANGTWTERVLRFFGDTVGDGQQPFGNLVRDKRGNLYGVTTYGGLNGLGTVFKVDATGQEMVLHTFTGGPTDGAKPTAGLAMDASGSLYGTTFSGGDGPAAVCGTGVPRGCGTVFKITP